MKNTVLMIKREKFLKTIMMILLLILTPLFSNDNNSPNGLTSSDEFGVFINSIIQDQLKKQNIPGMVFVIVKDGEVFFSNGYGVSNLRLKEKMDPDKSLLYLASVTKTFTAAASLQLVNQGKLDLNKDVNDYLTEFKIDNNYTEPVNLSHLLTHTAGFDDKNIGYVSPDSSNVLKLSEYLKKNMPPRVMPPGEISSYSNHGFGLAGYLIELASGLSYSNYLENFIFKPLEMNNSQAYLPLTKNGKKNLVTSYDYDYRSRGLLPINDLGYRNLPPAGIITTTGSDMGKFLTALLDDNRSLTKDVFPQSVKNKMFSRQFTHHPLLSGFAYGLYEIKINGERILTHAGGFVGNSSQIFLLPEKKIGVFVASNRSKFSVYKYILSKIINKYITSRSSVITPDKEKINYKNEDLSKYNGIYQYTRYSRNTIEKIAIWDSLTRVEAGIDGFLLLYQPYSKAVKLKNVGKNLFFHKKSGEYVTFKEDKKGNITHMFYSMSGSGLPSAFEKLSWTDDKRLHNVILMFLIFINFVILIFWPISAFIKRFIKKNSKPIHKDFKRQMIFVRLNSFLTLIFITGIDTLIGNSSYRLKLIWGMAIEMKILLFIPFLSIGLIIMLGYSSYKARLAKTISSFKLYFIYFFIFTNIVFIAFLLNWNLLGFIY